MIYEYNGTNLGVDKAILFFYATWSKSCIVNEEILHNLDSNYNELNIYKINTTRFYEMKKKYNVNKIPSYAIIKGGRLISLYSGAINYRFLKDWLEKNMVI